jgi:hypothetical protein
MKLPPAKKRGQAVAEFFESSPDSTLTDAEVERTFGAFNNARKDYERWAAHFLPGVTRDTFGMWSYAAPPTLRGQGKLCKGRLTITLSGPKGSGKSLVEKILRAILPLTPVNEVEIIKE